MAVPRPARLSLNLDTRDMVRSLPIFAKLDEAQVKRLGRYLKPRLVMPGTYVIRKDDFLKFLTEYPEVRAEIEQTAMSRAEDNRMSLLR